MSKNLKIATKLFLGFVLVAGVAILASGYFGYQASKKTLEQEMFRDLDIMAYLQQGFLLEYSDHIHTRARGFASDRFLRDKVTAIVSGDQSATAELNQYLSFTKKPIDNDISGINIFDMDGFVIASTQEKLMGQNFATASYFQKAITADSQNSSVDEVFYPGIFEPNEASFAVSAPLFDSNTGKQIGVLANYFRVSELTNILSGKRIRERDTVNAFGEAWDYKKIFLVDKNGIIITGSDHLETTPLSQKIATLPVLECARDHTTTEGKYLDYQEIPVIGVSVCMDNGWTLIAEKNEKIASAGLLEIRRNMLLIALSTMIFVILFAYIIGEQIRKPLQSFSEMTKRIGKGDFSKKIDVKSDDEVGVLGGFMNEMSDRLKEMHLNLGARLKEKEGDLKKFQLAVENSSDHIVITDANGIILYANPAVGKITGYPVNDIIGKKAGSKELWGGQMEKQVYEKFWHTIKVEKKTYYGEIINKHKNGTPYHAEVKVDPVLDQAGEVVYFVGIERNITEEKELQQMRNDFITIVSHQLRTPLGSMRWVLELLLSEDSIDMEKEGVKSSIQDVYRSTKRLLRLVQSLLSLSRIDRGKFIRTNVSTDLSVIITNTMEEIATFAEEKKVTIHLNIEKGKEYYSKVDPTMFQEVIENLLSNGVKYNRPGGELSLTLASDKKFITIDIKDNGIGIPAKDLEKVFWKFYRSENAQKHETNGTGIGLFIVKSHIEEWGGEVRLESQEDKGSTFFIRIPRAQKPSQE